MTDHEFKAPKRTTTEPSDETTARLAEIRDRANAATEGPWEHGDRQYVYGVTGRFGDDRCPHCARTGFGDGPSWAGVRNINGKEMLVHVHTSDKPRRRHGVHAVRANGSISVVRDAEEYGYMYPADAEFIAHAREDVPWLLAEVERLTAERDRARGLAARLEAQIARVEALAEREDFGSVEDGFGMVVSRCAERCRVEVVRPGKVQCSPSCLLDHPEAGGE